MKAFGGVRFVRALALASPLAGCALPAAMATPVSDGGGATTAHASCPRTAPDDGTTCATTHHCEYHIGPPARRCLSAACDCVGGDGARHWSCQHFRCLGPLPPPEMA